MNAMPTITAFLENAGERLFRDLVKYHFHRTTARQMLLAVLEETAMLPEASQMRVEAYFDNLNMRFFQAGREWWDKTTCQSAFEQIMQIAVQDLYLDTIRLDYLMEDAIAARNQELSYSCFQLATLDFAYNAATERRMRRIMGIWKGLFG